MADAGNSVRRLAYTANWLDSPDVNPANPTSLGVGTNRSTLLFRAFDYLHAGPFAEGTPLGGRVAGKVNLNTIYNYIATSGGTQAAEQFLAVTDPPENTDQWAANRFVRSDANKPWDVARAWQGFVQARLQNNPQFSGAEKPLFGSAVAVGTAGAAVNTNSQDQSLTKQNGLWRTTQVGNIGANTSPDEGYTPTATGWAGAMQKYEMLSKTYQQLTTRSNVFAVYATIGYFEVLNDGPYDDANRPVLGKELGTDEGTVTRNKFFSVIDRTNLSVDPMTPQYPAPRQGARPVYFTYEPDVTIPNGIPAGNVFVVPDPDLTPIPNNPSQNLPAVQCRIPGVSQIVNQTAPNKTLSLSGYYDGTQWTIVDYTPVSNNGPVTLAMLDIGPKAELVQILFPPNAPALDNYGAATIILQAVGAQANPGKFQYRHARGAPIRLLTTNPTDSSYTQIVNPFIPATANQPGNPGPQAGFNYHANRFGQVVRYAEKIR
jgi:hypothetical protein